MEVCRELLDLANKCRESGHTLYVVGGYVRDSILGQPSNDIDICSDISYEEMTSICKSLKFKAIPVNKHLGTIHINTPAGVFEYTRLRRESYSNHGDHNPSEISFVNSIEEDVARRDLTINSVYYDICKDQIVDIVDGLKDINKGIIRTPNSPDITFNDDGLRILRCIRFASTFNFRYARPTYLALQKYACRLSRISKERILEEIKQLVVCDLKHNIPNRIFLNSFDKLKLGKYVFNNTLDRLKKFSSKDKSTFYSLPSECRLVAFYILIIRRYLIGYCKDNQLQFVINSLLGRDGIKESNNTQRTVHKLFKIIQNLNYLDDTLTASINYLTCSDAERKIIESYLTNKAKHELSDNIYAIKINNIPLSANELDITPDDIISSGIEEKYISKILTTLYNQVLSMKVKNKNSDLLELAINIHKTLSELSKEKK